ncbi:MAG: ATP-binding protein [Dyadobacter sp.]|uniref:ATP-binding protein n=1 Tax=Dyadobacter sp. TaxID=1914288 RepID=UPI00326718FB
MKLDFEPVLWYFFGINSNLTEITHVLDRSDQFPGYLKFLLLIGILLIQSFYLVFAQSVIFPQPETIAAKQGLPQGFVPGILQDERGFIWMATRDGLCRYDGHHFKVYHPGDGDGPSLSSPGLENLQLGPDKKIWITSDQSNIDVFDPIRETFMNYSRQPFFRKAFGKTFIKGIFPDQQNRLWIITDQPGVVSIDLNGKRLHRYQNPVGKGSMLGNTVVRDMTEDRQGNIWAVTRNGIYRLGKNSSKFERYRSGSSEFNANESKVYAMKERRNGELLLLSTNRLIILKPLTGECRGYDLPEDKKPELKHIITVDSKGNDYFYRMDALFRYSDNEGVQVLPKQPDIKDYKSVFVDRSDVLWAGTDGNGVRKFNLRAGYFNTASYSIGFIKDLLIRFLKVPESEVAVLPKDMFPYNFRYTFDRAGDMWFNAGATPFYKLEMRTKKLLTIPFPVTIKDIKRSELSISLATDPDGKIWAVHDTLVQWYENDQWNTFMHPLRPQIESGIHQIVVDRQALWIATTARGLYRVDKITGAVRHFTNQAGSPNSLSNNNLYCLSGDPLDDNLLWVGTFGGGLNCFNKRTGLSRRITKKEGLPNDVVYAAIPDRYGHVWVATNQGLCQVDRKTFKTRTYTREDGLMGEEFNRFHFLQLPTGPIFMGGLEGITGFDPSRPNEDHYQPPVHLTSVFINNQELLPGTLTGRLPITSISQLKLDYNQNFVTVEFAGLQYNRSDRIKFRYRLEGLEPEWTETENPVTVYTDLKPGNYVLRMNASNTVGNWSSHIRTLEIDISPPWWATWWAYAGYALAFIAICYWFISFYINRLKMRQIIAFSEKEVALKVKEATQLREVDEIKTRFFSNITHEFRTPLTLILSPTEQMLTESREGKDVSRLSLVKRNAHQLLNLVNQLLDLSRLESGRMTVREVEGDLVDFIGQLVQAFKPIADDKGIVLEFEHLLNSENYWFDKEKLERVLNNLLSNAIKFTNSGGMAQIRLKGMESGVEIIVGDTGIGIMAENLPHIFERFYRIDDNGEETQTGSGIGLAIVKELVELQGGTVSVRNDDEKLSTLFTLHLPFRQAGLTKVGSLAGYQTTGERFEIAADNGNALRADILLVEDNIELGDFIADNLTGQYNIHRAANGAEGLILAAHLMPDLVISDVMMPVMDGYTLCQKLKSDLHTSHIPVILLTAKAAVESRMSGLQFGADDYITKPFHLPEVKLRVRNLLLRQQRFNDWLRINLSQPGPLTSIPESEILDPFLEKLYAILDSQLDNTDFGVSELVKEIGMSSSSLNRKLKILANLSAVELIRNYRLKKAAVFLSGGKTVSESAYLVGFDNLSYFARCFRDLYQMTPTEFIEK